MDTTNTSHYFGKRILLIDGGSRQVLPMIKGFHNLGCTVTVYCNSKLDVGYVYKYIYNSENSTGSLYIIYNYIYIYIRFYEFRHLIIYIYIYI